MTDTRIAIFASGSGSTAEAFIRDAFTKQYPLSTVLLVCNNPNAFVLERIYKLNAELGLAISSLVINSHIPKSQDEIVHGQQTDTEQQSILQALTDHKVDLVLLLGYMKRIGPKLLAIYGWSPGCKSVYETHMLNTHPGILPETVGTHGLGTQEFTLAKGLRMGGQTLHAVSAEYDMGPVIAEHRVPIEPGDSAESLFARVQTIEKQHIADDVLGFIQAQQQYRKETR